MSKLVYYGGDGFEGLRFDGDYEVRTKSGTRKFNNLPEARSYYNSLQETIFFWDTTNIPELIDAYTEK